MTSPAVEDRDGRREAPARSPRPPRAPVPVHRDALLSAARGRLDSGGGVLLTGPAGIGKSTLLTQLAGEYAARGHRTLYCAPSESDRRLPFLGLIDLLSESLDEVFDRLEPGHRTALNAALMRSSEPDGGRELLTLRMAVLAAFRALSARHPLLLVVDDAQWLDAPSKEALAFVAKRVAGPAVSALVAVQVEDGGQPVDQRICPRPVLAIRVPPMTVAEVTALLAAHGERRWPRDLLSRIHKAAGGNPHFALELARALAERNPAGDARLPDPDDPLPLPQSLRGLMLSRLEALSPDALRTLLIASATARPSLRLLQQAGCDGAATHVDEAIRAGIVELATDGSVRFTHPLMPTVMYNEATPQARLDAHTALAEVVEDPVERARQLALVSPGRDAQIAAALADAASVARRRGAPATAARLGRLAADHTPADEQRTAIDRRLTAAEDAVAAGEPALARGIAHEVLSRAKSPAERVRAWNTIVDSCGQAMAEISDVFAQAMEDARDDPGLLAQLHYRLCFQTWIATGRAAEAHTHAARSAVLARRAGDRRTEVLALSQQATLEYFLGRAEEAERTVALALARPHDARAMIDHNGPILLKHRRLILHDRLDDARTELRSLLYTVRQRGAAESVSVCLHSLAQVEVARGRCDRALDLARQSLRVSEKAGLSQGPTWWAIALAEAAGGCLDRALTAAERAKRHCADDDDVLFMPRALHAEGHIRLLQGEDSAAVRLLRRVRRLETEQGQGDPAVRRWQADLAEALVRTGAVDEAAALVAETREQAARLGRRGVLAVMGRAAALVTEARGDLDAAAVELGRAAERLGALPYPLEEGRTRLALGRVHARRGDIRAAQAALTAAHRVFDRCGARPWLAQAARVAAGLEHLEHLGRLEHLEQMPAQAAGGSWLDALTDTERRVVMLVARGASNREIAAELVVSVKTVEAALTRTYRKLGVRSRVDVARMAMAAEASAETATTQSD